MRKVMALVDDVWDRMSFRTPWSGERERDAVHDALARFVAWQARPGARTHVTSEGQITATVELPDGQQVRLIGYVDRLELDDDGHVVVVDLKTGKYAPTDASLPENPQLGLYQLAVDHGAADRAVGRPVRSGGAELVQLRLGGDLPKVQPQAPQVPDSEGVTTIQRQLMAAVRAIRDEDFVARPGGHCDRCDFHAICPAKSSGSVLS
jgi:RecB family exonuclease